MVPCVCNDELIAAKISNQCRRCKVFIDICCDNIHFYENDEDEEKTCISCKKHEELVAAYNVKVKGK